MSEYSLLARSLARCVFGGRISDFLSDLTLETGVKSLLLLTGESHKHQDLFLQTSVSPSAQLHPPLREQAHVCSFSSLLWENENSCISWLYKDGWRILLLVVVKCSMLQYLCVLPPSDPGDYLPPALADDIQPPLFSWYTVRGRGANSLFKCLSAWTNT